MSQNVVATKLFYLVRVADHGNVDVRVSSNLLLRDDDLGGQGVLRVGNWMVEKTNATDNLSDLAGAVWCVRRIAVNLGTDSIKFQFETINSGDLNSGYPNNRTI